MPVPEDEAAVEMALLDEIDQLYRVEQDGRRYLKRVLVLAAGKLLIG